MNHHSQLGIFGAERLRLALGSAAFVARQIKPESCFLTFARSNLQMAPEFRGRFPLGPTFNDVCRNRTRTTANLSSQFVLLVLRETLRQARDLQRKPISLLKNEQITISADGPSAIRLFVHFLSFLCFLFPRTIGARALPPFPRHPSCRLRPRNSGRTCAKSPGPGARLCLPCARPQEL